MSRSEEMRYVSVTIPNELVNDTIRALGDFGMFHIEDLVAGKAASKHHFAFKKRLTEITEIEKKLKGFEELMKKLDIPVPHLDFHTDLGATGDETIKNNPDIVIGASDFVNEFENQLNPNIGFEKSIQAEIARRIEMRAVLTEAPHLVPAGVQSSDGESAALSFDFSSGYHEDDTHLDGDGLSNYICGVIPTKNQLLFSRLVQRVSRGANAIVKFANPIPQPISDPETGDMVTKTVFCVITIGTRLNKQIRKLCAPVGASIYPVPSQPELVASEASRLDSEIREQQETLTRTVSSITELLEGLATQTERLSGGISPCSLRLWQQLLFREKLMIDALMKCEFHATLVYMAGWVPLSRLESLSNVISDCGIHGGASPAIDRRAVAPRDSVPPTYIESNKFTSSFQGIVDTYGIPRYQEFNPGLFTIVTFPFLFGVMYGDIGHGSIICLVGLLFILFENVFERMRKNGTMNEMLDMIYGGRYIIALMGLFGLYCGIIYNDFMSIPWNVYGSTYTIDPASTTRVWDGHVYPFGVDPGWYHNKNTLKFFNSFKMKTAVILGVIHMTFGIFVSLSNHLYFKDHVAIACEFLPRLILMLSTFGYMILMIFIKWCTDWTLIKDAQPPNLIQTMIDMYLSPGSVEAKDLLYSGQETVQTALLIIAVITIPWMLCPKPIIEHNKRQGKCASFSWLHSPVDEEYRRAHALHDDEHNVDAAGFHGIGIHESNSSDDLGHHNEEAAAHKDHHSFGDLMIHQAIHTIEFILGTVSNTASYLRLWALSLAHAQLAEVFWEKMIFEYGILNSGILGFFGTGIWVIATVGVILAMDSLECFLHALRLHWVEFQNKFYYADGIRFKPFDFVPEED